jgi:CBS domain-containing protein
MPNASVVAFNMLPAFPMDGGRVLRALLGLVIGKPRATRIAAAIGQLLAVLMGIYGAGVFGAPANYGLCIIALFVYFGAGQERRVEETTEVFAGATVGDAMVRDFASLAAGDSLQRAVDLLLSSSQQDFPVLTGDSVEGVLSRSQLLRALAADGPGGAVGGVLGREVVFAAPEDDVEDYLLRPDGVQRAPVLVRDAAGALVGMLTLENLMEYMTVRQIAERREAGG